MPPKMTSSFPDLLKIFFDERRACPVKIKSSKVPFINQRGILLSSSLIASSASDAHPAGKGKARKGSISRSAIPHYIPVAAAGIGIIGKPRVQRA